jgi:hypothetical protein
MDKVFKSLAMVAFMKGTIRMGKCTGKENIRGRMVKYIKVNGLIT